VPPFPATVWAEGRHIKGGPSLWERVRVRGFVPRPAGPLTPALSLGEKELGPLPS